MAETYFFLRRRTGPLPRAKICYSIAHSEKQRQIVLAAYRKGQDAKYWELIEEDANGRRLNSTEVQA